MARETIVWSVYIKFILKLCVYGNFMFEYENAKGMRQWRNRMYVMMCVSFFIETVATKIGLRWYWVRLTLACYVGTVLLLLLLLKEVVIMFLLLLSYVRRKSRFSFSSIIIRTHSVCAQIYVFGILFCIVPILQVRIQKPIRQNSLVKIKLMIQSSSYVWQHKQLYINTNCLCIVWRRHCYYCHCVRNTQLTTITLKRTNQSFIIMFTLYSISCYQIG